MQEFRGKIFQSFNELCKEYDQPDSRVRQRIKLGWSLEEALGLIQRVSKSRDNARKIAVQVVDPARGTKLFLSLKDATKYYGLPYDRVVQRLNKHKWTIEQSLGLKAPPLRKAHNALFIEVDGKTFSSRTKCSEHYQIDQRLVHTRLKRNWTLKEALGIVPRQPNSFTPDHMCEIYEIRDLVYLKSYVGITINTHKERFNQHVYASTRSQEVGSLQHAIYLLGRENFEVSCIEKVELRLLGEREKYWIDVKKSLAPKGYNQNAGGAGLGGSADIFRAIEYAGKHYANYSEIAREHGIKPPTLHARLKRMSLERALSKKFRKSPNTKKTR
jgi:hypothetical protein